MLHIVSIYLDKITSLKALLTLPLILFLSLTTNGVSARHAGISIVDQPPAVIDTYGNSLRKGEYYHLRPYVSLRPLGVAIIIGLSNYTCDPLLSVRTLGDEYFGVPVKFLSVEPDEDEVIRESTDLYIEFSDRLLPTCGGSLLGVLADQRTFSLGGAKEDKSSWFKIEKAAEVRDGFYKLVSTRYGRAIGTSTGSSTDFSGRIENLVLADKP